ncbi:MAG: hypothetical protein N2B03_04500 [Boseongicola sp.]
MSNLYPCGQLARLRPGWPVRGLRTATAAFALIALTGCGGFDSLTGSSGIGDSLGGSSGFDSLGGSSGFGGAGEGTPSAPLQFRAGLQRGEDRRDFTVRARAGGATVEQVRESVRFRATRYCIPTFGGSDVEWAIDPVTDDWAFTRDRSEMVFSGRCTRR